MEVERRDNLKRQEQWQKPLDTGHNQCDEHIAVLTLPLLFVVLFCLYSGGKQSLP